MGNGWRFGILLSSFQGGNIRNKMNILIVKLSSLGDIFQCFPLLTYLKEVIPGVEIDWAVRPVFQDPLEAHPLVRKVIPIDLKSYRLLRKKENRAQFFRDRFTLRRVFYTVIFDLQGNINSALVTWSARGRDKVGFSSCSIPERVAGVVLSKRYPNLSHHSRRENYLNLVTSYFSKPFPDDMYRLSKVKLALPYFRKERVEALLLKAKNRSKIMIAIGSSQWSKNITRSCWISFLRSVAKKIDPFFFFVSGGDRELKDSEAIARTIDPEKRIVLEKLGVPSWQYLMAKMDWVIGVDSSAIHLAVTTHTPVFALFGPSLGACYYPPVQKGTDPHFIQGSCPYKEVFKWRCNQIKTCKTARCIKTLSPEKMAKRFCALFTTNR